MVVLKNRLLFRGIFYAVFQLVGRLLGLKVYQTARIFPVFQQMNHGIGRPLALIAGVVAAGAARPAVFQRPRRGDLLLGQHTGYLGRTVPGKAKAVNLPYHRGGFLVNDKVFVLVHEVAIDGLACDGLSAHALRAFYCLDFLARISHQPFVKNVPQRGKIIFPLCAVHSVIDSDEACGASGDVIDFAALLHGLGKREAAVRLAEDFGVSYEKSGNAPPDRKRHNRSQPRQKSAEQRFQETERYCFRVLCDYLRLLEHWKTAHAPQPQDAIWHPLFVEALQRISYTEYLLDILLYGEIEEKAALIAAQGKEVLRLEQRISELAAGNAGSGQKDDGHNGTGADTGRNPGNIRGDAERRREEQHPKLPDGVPA